jgi:hypothetical protein
MVAEVVLGIGWPITLALTVYYGLGLKSRVTLRRVMTPFSEFSRFYTKLTWSICTAILLTTAVIWDDRLATPIRDLGGLFILSSTALGIVIAFRRGPRPARPGQLRASEPEAEESDGYAKAIHDLERGMSEGSMADPPEPGPSSERTLRRRQGQ